MGFGDVFISFEVVTVTKVNPICLQLSLRYHIRGLTSDVPFKNYYRAFVKSLANQEHCSYDGTPVSLKFFFVVLISWS